MIFEAITGVIVGLLLGPVLFMIIGLLAYSRTNKKERKKIEEIRYEHKKQINQIKKQYEKRHRKYMKLRTKLIKEVDRLAEKHKGVES